MILPAQLIRARSHMIEPFHERTRLHGMTFGLSPAGYDVRIAEEVIVQPGNHFVILASTIERFTFPTNILGRLCDKSSWARLGLLVQNTVMEPGWRGHLTLELTYHGRNLLRIPAGSPIGQVIFEMLAEHTEQPYEGKYQDQKAGPQPAIHEGWVDHPMAGSL